MKRNLALTTLTCSLALAISSRAEEGGSAHYLPGMGASFIDAFPGKPGSLAVLNYFLYYNGSAAGNRPLPIGGLLTAGLDATVYADTLAAIYQTPWHVLGGGLAVGAQVHACHQRRLLAVDPVFPQQDHLGRGRCTK